MTMMFTDHHIADYLNRQSSVKNGQMTEEIREIVLELQKSARAASASTAEQVASAEGDLTELRYRVTSGLTSEDGGDRDAAVVQIGELLSTLQSSQMLLRELQSTPQLIDLATHQLRPTHNIPFQRDKQFVEREELSDQLNVATSGPTPRVALVGLGGVGHVRPSYILELLDANSRLVSLRWP